MIFNIVLALWLVYSLTAAVLATLFFGPLWIKRPFSCLIYLPYSFFAANAKLVVYVLAPFAALLSVVFKWENLPTGLNWMQTHDDDLTPKNHPLYRPLPVGFFQTFWYRLCWLYRNPAYGFMHRQLGVDAPYKTAKPVLLDAWDEWHAGQPSIERALYLESNAGCYVRANKLVFGKLLYVWLGWKLIRNDPDGRRMLAMGVQIK